ncbi:unnamed protein product, partial [Bubo scandiacus]
CKQWKATVLDPWPPKCTSQHHCCAVGSCCHPCTLPWHVGLYLSRPPSASRAKHDNMIVVLNADKAKLGQASVRQLVQFDFK